MKRFIYIGIVTVLIVFLNLYGLKQAYAVTIGAVTPNPAKVGSAVTITGTFSGASLSAKVSFGDGTQSSCLTTSNFSTTHVFRSAGAFTITATEYRSSGCVQVLASVSTSLSVYDLLINRAEFKFTDGRGDTSIEEDGKLSLSAVIRYSGAGVLMGRWEVDDIPVGAFNKTLITGRNGGTVTVESPLLPTFDTGNHEVKLVIIRPSISFTFPTLAYFVFPKGSPPAETSTSRSYPLVASASSYIPPPEWEFSKEGRITFLYEDDLDRSPDSLRPFDTFDRQVWGQADLSLMVKRGRDTFTFAASPRYFNMDEKGDGTDRLWNLPSVYLSLAHDGDRWQGNIELGDINIDESMMTVSGLTRRGVGAGFVLFDRVKVKSFSVRNTDTVAVSDGLGIGERDFRLDGGSIGIDIMERGLLTVKTVYLNGRLGDQNFFNIATGEPPVRGETTGFVILSSLSDYGVTGEIEFVKSDFDSDTTDTEASKRDEAKRANISFTRGGANLGGEIFRIGRDFRSIGNLGAPWDQEGYRLSGGYAWESVSFSLSFDDSRDNVTKELDRSQIETKTGSAGINYSPFSWLNIGGNYSRTLQNSRFDPLYTIPVDNSTDTYGASFNIYYKSFTAMAETDISRLNDNSELNLDNRSSNVTLSGSYQREGLLSIAPSYQFARFKDISTMVRTDSKVITIDGSLVLFHNIINLDLRGSASYNKSTDNLQKDRTYDLFSRLSLNIGNIVEHIGSQTVSLKYEYTDVNDDVDDTNDRTEKIIFLAFESSLDF